MIRAFVVYCMVLNPTMCRNLEIVPDDGHKIASQMECLLGGAIFDAQTRISQQTPASQDAELRITYEGIEWRVKYIMCKQEGDDDNGVHQWVEEQKRRALLSKPQTE